MKRPRAVAAQGHWLAIADNGNNRVVAVDRRAGLGFAFGTGLAGETDGAANQAEFFFPNGVAFNSSGSLLVADTDNNKIRRIDSDGVVSTFAGDGHIGGIDGPAADARFAGPAGIASDKSGNVYVTDLLSGEVRTIGTDGMVRTLASGFNRPFAVATGPDGTVYVADTDNHRIARIGKDGQVSVLAGSGEYGYADGPVAEAKFAFPRGLAVSDEGAVFVADSGNNRIRVIKGGNVTTFAGTGEAGFVDGPLGQARFWEPSGLAVDPVTGGILVADYNNHRIRLLIP